MDILEWFFLIKFFWLVDGLGLVLEFYFNSFVGVLFGFLFVSKLKFIELE